MKYKCFILFILLGYPTQKGIAQQDGFEILNALATKIIVATDNSPDLFLHMDKTIQAAGGTLWCKAYLYHHSNHLPYTTPVIVYIDVMDSRDSLVKQVVLESSDLQLEAGIPLPHTLATGYYTVRAYTGNMAKSHPEKIFTCPVFISNVLHAATTPLDPPCVRKYYNQQQKEEVQFIPEGNWLINGIDNKMVVLSFDKEGQPIPITGLVKDSYDSSIASFQTGATGITSFSFQPIKGRKYRALLSKEGKPWKAISLPEVAINAYQLALMKEDGSNLYFRVGLSDLLYTKKPDSYLIGVSNGRICFSAMGKGMYVVTVPKKNFPQGIAEFYLFDDKQQLVSRRKIFTGMETVAVSMTPNKEEYMGRSTVKIDIAVNDSSGKPLMALLSVVVTDQKTVPEPVTPSFPDYSQKEQGNLPAQARHKMAELTLKEKDLLLMADNFPLSLPLEKKPGNSDSTEFPGLIIKGRLLKANREPVANQPISLICEEQRNILLFDTTDAMGHFQFTPIRYYDSTKFFIYAATKNQNVNDWIIQLEKNQVTIDSLAGFRTFCITDSSYQKNIQAFSKNFADSFLTSSTKIWLQEVTVRALGKGKGKAFDKQKNRFTRLITREELSKLSLSSTVNAVKMVPGVIMIGNKLTIRGGMQGIDISAGNDIEPLLIVDGVPARTSTGIVDYLNSIPPDNIDYIEVLTGPEAAMYATRGANGVIIVKTGLPGNIINKQQNMKAFYPDGFHYTPDFYQPSYELDAVREARFTDNRSTIYWNGHLQTDNKGKVAIQFYTADSRTTYWVTLTGLSAKGDIIYKQLTITRN